MTVLFLVGHEYLNHLVPRAGKAVQAAGDDGSTQLVERQGGAENLDSCTPPRIGSGGTTLSHRRAWNSITNDHAFSDGQMEI